MSVESDFTTDGGLRLAGSQEKIHPQPVAQQARPGPENRIAAIEPDAVSAVLVNVELGGDFFLPQREIKAGRVFSRHRRIGIGLKKKCRRGLFGDVVLGREFFRKGLVFVPIGTEKIFPRAAMHDGRIKADHGITEDRKIGTGAHFVDRVRGLVGFFIVERRGHAGEVASGGKSHHRETGGIDLVVAGMGPHPADRPLHIGKLGRVMMPLTAEAVMQDKGGNPLSIKPLRDLVPFVIGREPAVAASGADDDSGTGVAFAAFARVEFERGRSGFLVDRQGKGRFPLGPERGGLLRQEPSAQENQDTQNREIFHTPRLDLSASISDFSSRTCSRSEAISSSISVRHVDAGTADSAREETAMTGLGATSPQRRCT